MNLEVSIDNAYQARLEATEALSVAVEGLGIEQVSMLVLLNVYQVLPHWDVRRVWFTPWRRPALRYRGVPFKA